MKKTSITKPSAIAACAFEIQANKDRIQLFPAGKFRAIDGRPAECASWYLDDALANNLIRALASRKNPIVIDYEHQTLHAEQNGKPAPAAGWINAQSLTWTPEGLFAEVTWTERARELIKNGEYRFISPVFGYDSSTGAITYFIHAALTNDPGLDGMSAVTLAAASRLAATHQPTEKSTVNEELLKMLRKLLGLGADADEAAILAALQKMTADMESSGEGDAAHASLSVTLDALKTHKEKVAALTGALTAAKTTTGSDPDPAKFVPVAALTAVQQQMAELAARVNGSELDTLVGGALKDGRLLPALEPWARELGGKDIAALKSYLDKAPAIEALSSQQSGGKPPAGNTHGLSATELQVAALSNMTAEEFAAAKKLMENV